MSNRCLSVSNQYEFELPTSLVYSQAVLFEDINEDTKNELIIGNGNGEIFVYKGASTTPWLKNTKPVGCITCLCYDDITNIKRKHLIVLDSIGCLTLFSINQLRKRYASDMQTTKSQANEWKLELRQMYQSRLLPNPKYMVVNETPNNGIKDFFVAYSDRKIHMYRWNPFNVQPISTSNNSVNSSNIHYVFQENGKFVLQQSWELDDQIYSLCISPDYIGNSSAKCILATQPGAKIRYYRFSTSCILASSQLASASSSSSSLVDLITATNQRASRHSALIQTQQTVSSGGSGVHSQLSFQPSASVKSYCSMEEIGNFSGEINSNDASIVPTFLLTNVNYQQSSTYAFLITLYGDIFFMNLSMLNNKKSAIWHKTINAIVINHFKADINKDGNDELILATPDGIMYIVSCVGEVISYDLGEPIHLFHFGYYAFELSAINSVLDPSVSSFDIDSYQTNTAFDMAMMDSPPNTSPNENMPFSANKLHAIFLSSITNKICMTQIDHLVSNAKSNNQIKYKCDNVLSKRDQLVQILSKNFQVNDSQSLEKVLKYLLYYQNTLNTDDCVDEDDNQVR